VSDERAAVKPYPPIDATGEPLAIGDIVRVVGVPDLSGMQSDGRAESQQAIDTDRPRRA
jgi:hypothetical protein